MRSYQKKNNVFRVIYWKPSLYELKILILKIPGRIFNFWLKKEDQNWQSWCHGRYTFIDIYFDQGVNTTAVGNSLWLLAFEHTRELMLNICGNSFIYFRFFRLNSWGPSLHPLSFNFWFRLVIFFRKMLLFAQSISKMKANLEKQN